MDVLVIVDMQNDFIDGALGTKEAQEIVSKVINKIQNFNGGVIAYTMDTHDEMYLATQEGRKLPVKHCILGTTGWEIQTDVKNAINNKDATILRFEKGTYGSDALSNWIREHADQLDKITFIGLCTGICVISNVMLAKVAAPEVEIVVDASCCACVTPCSHDTALSAMKLCNVTIENWEI